MNNLIAFDKEFLSLQKSLKSYLYRLSANKLDTEDLLHDTYIKAKQNISSFKGNSSIKTWIFAIATNLARDNNRVKNRWELDAQDKCKNATVNSVDCQYRINLSFNNQATKNFELCEHINYCFTCLSKNLKLEEQIALILKEIFHFTIKEISEIINKTQSVVKHLLHNSREKLQIVYSNRCSLINKSGVCYQCAELNDYLQDRKDSFQKINKLGLSDQNSSKENLNIRLRLIEKINPMEGDGAELEDTIMQILRKEINDF